MPPPRPALLLGLAGLAPFAAAAVLAVLAPPTIARLAATALLLYGAIILSFMGGCRWGFAAAGLGQGPTWSLLSLSVAPALWAFFLATPALSGLLDPRLGMAGLAAGFVALYAWDVDATRTGAAPAWWTRLRTPLTAGATAALLIGAAGA